ASVVKSRTMVSYGDPAKEIVRIAEEESVDLIVIATHGLTGWQHLVFGSVAEKVVRTAKCPVLTVRCPGS
ncbi:MAG TPA: universal stress protein, partial [Acidobacteriota bacterium]|nr:universal stress protein [Acidobacteriota bacterium]